MSEIYHLTADELLDMLDMFGEVTVMSEGPRNLIPDGATLLWPSFVADYTADDGRHIDSIVQLDECFNVILVSPDLYEAIK